MLWFTGLDLAAVLTWFVFVFGGSGENHGLGLGSGENGLVNSTLKSTSTILCLRTVIAR